MATTVTSKGQVTIPKPVRDHLGIAPGSQVEFRRAARRQHRDRESRWDDGQPSRFAKAASVSPVRVLPPTNSWLSCAATSRNDAGRFERPAGRFHRRTRGVVRSGRWHSSSDAALARATSDQRRHLCRNVDSLSTIEDVDAMLRGSWTSTVAPMPRMALFLAGKAYRSVPQRRWRPQQRPAGFFHWRARRGRTVAAPDAGCAALPNLFPDS